jgi:uncharacterized protein involved in exopolysaccharide biosynthesis
MEQLTERRGAAGPEGLRPAAGPQQGRAPQPGATEVPDVSLLALVNVILRHRTLVLVITAATTLVTVGVIWGRPRVFRTTATFMELSRAPNVGASGLAAQLGLTVAGLGGSQSPQFYVDLLASRAILGPLVDRRYHVHTPSGDREATLVEVYRPPGKTPALRRDAAIDQLGRAITTSVAATTGVITLNVDDPSPDLARQIAADALELVNTFNLERRQTQAGAELRFTEQRLAETRAELSAAEVRLENFLDQNRTYGTSPALRLAFDRLTRDVNLRQQIYITVAGSYEQAKVDAIRNNPVITIIAPPETPVRPRPRRLIQWTAVAIFVGLLIGIVTAFGREYMLWAASSNELDVDEFRALKHEALGDLSHPWRPALRLLARRRRA